MTTENMPVSELRKYFENHFHHDLLPTISIVTPMAESFVAGCDILLKFHNCPRNLCVISMNK